MLWSRYNAQCNISFPLVEARDGPQKPEAIPQLLKCNSLVISSKLQFLFFDKSRNYSSQLKLKNMLPSSITLT